MEQILLIDASPRAPHSNSHGYAAIFMETSRAACTYIALRKSDLTQTVQKIERSSDIIFVSPAALAGALSEDRTFGYDTAAPHPRDPQLRVSRAMAK